MDPYKVLGVSPDASMDDIKRAYRDLARKYHPDNYVNNPLADLAEAKMKEINEAYDMIVNQRTASSTPNSAGCNGSYNGQRQSGAGAGIYTQIRSAINAGNLAFAEELLQHAPTRDAEWYFLMGTVHQRKGWYDEAKRCYMQAYQMDPNNLEYRNALNNLNMSAGYGGYHPMDSSGACDCCAQLICLNCLCQCCGGGW